MVTIQPAPVADAVEIAALQANPCTANWTTADFTSWLQQPDILALKASADNQLCGYLLITVSPPQADILDFAVAPTQRRQGIGAALLEYALRQLKMKQITELWGEVAVSNIAAWHLYQKQGAIAQTIRRNYYRLAAKQEDAQQFCVYLKNEL